MALTFRSLQAITSPTTPAPASCIRPPGHGADDYLVWLANGYRDIPETVDPDGAYYPSVPLFGGLKVLETEGKKAGKFGPANSAVMDKLIEAGNLLARGRVEHSYPHSWRSQAPVIFRNTPQWFIKMGEADDPKGLRNVALAAIDATAFYPETGGRRMRGHGGDPAGLADQPPARLGHAAGHVRGQAHRASPCRTPPSTPASSRR